MTKALLDTTEARPDLAAFFERLQECRDKTAHVHGLHPYPAKFIPHIPRALLGSLATRGDVILDPMCGSGTTLVEATMAGHNAIGVDLNPVATLVSRAKTNPLSAEDRLVLRNLAHALHVTAQRLACGERVDEVEQAPRPEFRNREKWFAENVTRELAYAKALITTTTGSARDLAFCAFSAILVAVSNQESETRWCAKPRALQDGTTAARLAAKLTESLERTAAYAALRSATATVRTADARQLPLEDGAVGLVVTSPPYANSHDYYLYNKLRMFWLDENVADVQRQEIGSRNRHSDMKEDIGTYIAAMSEVARECRRVTRSGGAMAIVVADAVIRGEFFEMDRVYNALASAAGFSAERAYRFGHRQFNSTFQRGFGTKREKETHVLIYRAA